MSFFYEILNDGTPYRRKKLRVKRLILTIAAALFMLITLLCSFAIIPSGYTGVRTTFGQIDTVAVSNGFIPCKGKRVFYMQQVRSLFCWLHIWIRFIMTRRRRSAIPQTEQL